MTEGQELIYSDYPDFNQAIDDEVGEIKIYGESFSPSYVLYEFKRETYRIALTEFLEKQFEDLQELVFDSFPALIAYNFRFQFVDPVQMILSKNFYISKMLGKAQ